MENEALKKLEEALAELSELEKKGLDTSSLKIFIKNYKQFIKINSQTKLFSEDLTFDKKLEIIQSFLEDKKAFPTIIEVIDFANSRLQLDFKDQKESRKTTISRIISRIKSKPDLKEQLKSAVLSIRNEMIHSSRTSKSKQQIISAETFSKWADIIKNI
ncbi:hypothetical protein ACFQZI_18230 [Mucilaginibacter lutimaris]|uniref:RiboL-PSP-HEPN domain-containing protein n=1 Tax=Mucilaginibacter lutimaris TaxID=931629 RepID=A0ABW2ZLD3_9SPHI